MSEIVFNSPTSKPSLESQVDSLQTTLASLNQQIIILQEALQEKDQKIAELEMELSQAGQVASGAPSRIDNTLTLVGALIKLYQFVFLPGKGLTDSSV